MPADVLEVTTKFMREPVRILVKKEELTLEGIKQFYINVEREVGTKCKTFAEVDANSCPFFVCSERHKMRNLSCLNTHIAIYLCVKRWLFFNVLESVNKTGKRQSFLQIIKFKAENICTC